MPKYREYHIAFDPKPIPDRRFDYDFWHEDYDGPEDSRCGNGDSVKDCTIKIDDLIMESEDRNDKPKENSAKRN